MRKALTLAAAAAGAAIVLTAGTLGGIAHAAVPRPPHCARTQELCDVVEYVTVQPDGTHKVWTCYLANPAYKPSPVSIRIAVYHCVSP